jgi:flagellin-like protein
MNVFGQSERSWRKARKRAVSPIIATILLVAITVVLAAVLYVLISGLTHGPGSTPIGSAFAVGNPTETTCTAAQVTAHQCATSGDELVTFTIEQSTITMGSVLFEVKAPAGTAYANAGAGQIAIMPLTGTTPVGYFAVPAGGLAQTSSFTFTGTFSSSTPISTTYSLTIDMGTLATAWTPGAGNYVIGLGVGSYSGTTSAVTIP